MAETRLAEAGGRRAEPRSAMKLGGCVSAVVRQQLLGAARNGRSAATRAAGTTRTGRAAPRRADGAGRGGRRRTGAGRCSPGRGAEDKLGRASPGPAAPHTRRSMPNTGARKWRARGDREGGGHRGPGNCASFDPEAEAFDWITSGQNQGPSSSRGAARRSVLDEGKADGPALSGRGLRDEHPCSGSCWPTRPCGDLLKISETGKQRGWWYSG